MEHSLEIPSSMPEVVVRLFGPPTASLHDVDVSLPEKALCSIAILAMAPRNKISTSELGEYLWRNETSAAANANLRQLYKRLKLRLDGVDIVFRNSGYWQLNTSVLSIDLIEFLNMDRPATPEEAEQILDCCAGDLLQGIETRRRSGRSTFGEAFDSWLLETRNYLRERCITVIRSFLGSELIPASRKRSVAESLLKFDCTEESAWRSIIEADLEAGQHAAAVRAYERCRRILDREFCAEPSIELKNIAAQATMGQGTDRSVQLAVGQADRELSQWLSAETTKPKIAIYIRKLSCDNKVLKKGIDKTTLAAEYIGSALAMERCLLIVAAPSDNLEFAEECLASHADYVVILSVRETVDCPIVVRLVGRARQTTTQCISVSLWSAEIPMADIGNAIVQVSQSIVGEVERAERDRAHSGGAESAYVHFLTGQDAVHKADLISLRRARTQFRAALKVDATYVPALSGMCRSYLMEWLLRGDPENAQIFQALELAELAVGHDPSDFRGRHRLGHVYLYLQRFDEALEQFTRALYLNPNNADLLADYADAQCHAVGTDAALATLSRAPAFDPIGRENRLWILASTYFLGGEYRSSIDTFNRLSTPDVGLSSRAASWAMLGEREIASEYAKKVKERNPFFSVSSSIMMTPNKDPEKRERHEAGLRLSGLD